MISYTVNDELVTSAVLTVEQLLSQQVGNDTGVAVAINGAVLPRSQWNRELIGGESIDILTAVQGG